MGGWGGVEGADALLWGSTRGLVGPKRGRDTRAAVPDLAVGCASMLWSSRGRAKRTHPCPPCTATRPPQSGLYSNHADIGPRYAGVLLGLSNTAGVLAGVLGTAATGFILQNGSWKQASSGALRVLQAEGAERGVSGGLAASSQRGCFAAACMLRRSYGQATAVDASLCAAACRCGAWPWRCTWWARWCGTSLPRVSRAGWEERMRAAQHFLEGKGRAGRGHARLRAALALTTVLTEAARALSFVAGEKIFD